MSTSPLPKPPRPHYDVPEERDPPEPLVELHEGLIPAFIPDDPEYERLIGPTSMRA